MPSVTIDITHYSLEERIRMHVSQSNQDRVFAFLEAETDALEFAFGSVHNHQAWPGGWRDHVTEGLNLAPPQFALLNAIRPVPCTLEDVVIGFLVHDLEKPWKYEVGADGQLHHTAAFAQKADDNAFRERMLAQYGITLTPLQANAMRYAEGEFVGYSNRERMMKEAAAIVHICDIISARIFYQYPLAENDPWEGARRLVTSS